MTIRSSICTLRKRGLGGKNLGREYFSIFPALRIRDVVSANSEAQLMCAALELSRGVNDLVIL